MDNQESPLLENQDEHPIDLPVSAVFPDGERKTYHFNKDSTVSELISEIMTDKSIEKPKDKGICIMYHGRILKSTEKFSEIDTIPDFAVSVVFRLNRNAAPSDGQNGEEDTELRGFDRLTRMNYTPDQISEIRHQFHFMRGGLNETHEQQLDAEEEWLPVIFNSENPLETLQNADAERPIRTQIRRRHQNYETFHFDQSSFWTTFCIALVLGIVFGPASLLYLLISLQDKAGIAGIAIGVGIHYLISICFHVSIF